MRTDSRGKNLLKRLGNTSSLHSGAVGTSKDKLNLKAQFGLKSRNSADSQVFDYLLRPAVVKVFLLKTNKKTGQFLVSVLLNQKLQVPEDSGFTATYLKPR